MDLTVEYIESRLKANELTVFFADDSDLIAEYIEEANSEVDNFLLQRYKYPYEFVSSLQSRAESEIRRYKFTCFRYSMYARKYDDEAMKEIKAQYQSCINKLISIKEHQTSIPGLVEINISPDIIKTDVREKIFTKDILRIYDN